MTQIEAVEYINDIAIDLGFIDVELVISKIYESFNKQVNDLEQCILKLERIIVAEVHTNGDFND